MPNRIIREGILRSPKVAKLSWAEEVFYRRLHSVVDDFGIYYANPGLLRADCYPRQLSKVSDSDVGKWLAACVAADLVRVYLAKDGERYLQVLKFKQQVRATKSKFPQPSECVADAEQLHSGGEANEHLGVDVSVSVCGPDPPTHAEKQINDASEPARKHSFRESQYFDPFSLQEKLSDWPEERVQEYHERMLSASDASHLTYFDWSAVAIQWYLRDQKPRRGR